MREVGVDLARTDRATPESVAKFYVHSPWPMGTVAAVSRCPL